MWHKFQVACSKLVRGVLESVVQACGRRLYCMTFHCGADGLYIYRVLKGGKGSLTVRV